MSFKTYESNVENRAGIDVFFGLVSFVGFKKSLEGINGLYSGRESVIWLFTLAKNKAALVFQPEIVGPSDKQPARIFMEVVAADGKEESVKFNFDADLFPPSEGMAQGLFAAIEKAASADILEMFRTAERKFDA